MKVVVLGFDGMDPTLLRRLQSEGLVGFTKLQSEGIASDLRSTVIPMSPSAWSSFLTGTNPGKHGIYDFLTRTGPGISDFGIVNSTHRKVPSLWHYLNANDLRAGILGVPVTYPTDEFDGFMVSGFPTPGLANSYHPPELESQVPVAMDRLHPQVLYSGSNKAAFVEDQFQHWRAMADLHSFALTDLDWDVLVTVFKQTDDIAHACWGEDPLVEAYQRADRVVQETIDTLEAMDDDFVLIVMSDHGFGPIDKTLFLNNVLRDLGYLQLRRSIGTRLRDTLSRRGFNLLNAYRWLAKGGLAEPVLSMSYGDSLLGTALESTRDKLFLGLHDIDPITSTAFARGNFGQIFLTDDAKTEELIADLLEYKVEDEPIIESVVPATEAFEGPELHRAPDLMIQTPDFRYITSRGFALATDRVLTDHPLQRVADHKPLGIFRAYGPSIESGIDVPTVDLEDFVPTILATLGCPIPGNTDGSVIEGIVGSRSYSSKEYSFGSVSAVETDFDDRAVRDQLESLGYTT